MGFFLSKVWFAVMGLRSRAAWVHMLANGHETLPTDPLLTPDCNSPGILANVFASR